MFSDDDVIFRYTLKQALEDGILVDLTQFDKSWEKGLFNYVTSNLLSRGYLTHDKYSKANILDLLVQSLEIVKKANKKRKTMDWLYVGEIELPSGEKQKIFIQQNETGKFTLMLPEDY
jgi:hypothetical protein